METKVSVRADFGNRISIKWNTDTFFFIRRETVIFVLSIFIDNRFVRLYAVLGGSVLYISCGLSAVKINEELLLLASHLLRDSKEILQLVHNSLLSIPDISRLV